MTTDVAGVSAVTRHATSSGIEVASLQQYKTLRQTLESLLYVTVNQWHTNTQFTLPQHWFYNNAPYRFSYLRLQLKLAMSFQSQKVKGQDHEVNNYIIYSATEPLH